MKILIAAKQNQKFPFHFLSAHPTPPAEEKKKGKENFWFLLPRPKGADEARRVRFTTQSERTMQYRATTRSARAKSVRLLFKKGSRKVYDYSTIHNLVGKFPRALARGEEKGGGENRISVLIKCKFGGGGKEGGDGVF